MRSIAPRVSLLVLLLLAFPGHTPIVAAGGTPPVTWEPVGLSGGGGMFSPAISPADPDLMMLNCDMGAAYLSEDGGYHWRMIHHTQLRTDTRCQPAFHPTDPDVIYASSGGRLRVSRDRGKTFAPIGDLTDRLAGQIAINPADPDLMLAGTRNGRCWRSTDAGHTWAVCKGAKGDLIAFHFDQTRPGQVMFAATDRGIWRSDNGGRTWAKKSNSLPSKKIRAFAGGSNARDDLIVLYAAVASQVTDGVLSGGIFRSLDRGETWQSAMGRGINTDTKTADQWAHGPVAQYKQLLTTDAQPLTVYATNTSTGFHPPHHDTVYRSDDGGDTWRDMLFEDPRFDDDNVAPNYVTASTGKSWKGGDVPFGVAIANTDPNRVMLVRNQCFITHNGGDTWFNGHTRPAPPPAPPPEAASQVASAPGQAPKPETAGREKLPGAGPGSAWVATGLVVTSTWQYAIDPFEPNRHYIAYTDLGWARSLDAGKTWIWWDPASWAPWRNTCYQIAFDPDRPGKMWGAFSNVHDIPNDNIISERHRHDRPGGVCLSHDFGASWQPTNQDLPPNPVTAIVLDPTSPPDSRTLYAGVFDRGVYKSTDDGKTWTRKSRGLGHPDNLRVSRVLLHKDGTLFAVVCAKRPGRRKPLMGQGVGIYRSTDGAETWEQINADHPFLYPKDLSVDPDDSRVLLVGACDTGGADRSGGLYRTTDGGVSWDRIGRQGPQTFGGYFHPTQKGWIYMTLTEGAPDAGLWLSRDAGKTWEPFDGLPFANIQRITFDPTDQAVMYVTTFGGSVWRGPVVPQGTPPTVVPTLDGRHTP